MAGSESPIVWSAAPLKVRPLLVTAPAEIGHPVDNGLQRIGG